MKIKLVNLAPLNEYGDYENDIQDLKDELAQLYRDQEETAEPEGGPIQNAIGAEIEAKQKEIEQAIGGSKQPKKDVPYDVAIGKMTQDEYDKHMLHVKYPKYYGPGGVKRFSTVKPDRASFEKSSKFDRKEGATPISTARALPNDKEYEDDDKDWETKADLNFENNESEANYDGEGWDDPRDENGKLLVGDDGVIKIGQLSLSGHAVKAIGRGEHPSGLKYNDILDKKLEILQQSLPKFKNPELAQTRFDDWLSDNYSWDKIKKQFKNEFREGSCGHGPDGIPGDTPGGTQGMNADTRTKGMIQKFIQKEIAKLSEEDSLEDKLKKAFSPEEMDKINSKLVPSFADMKPTDGHANPRNNRPKKS